MVEEVLGKGWAERVVMVDGLSLGEKIVIQYHGLMVGVGGSCGCVKGMNGVQLYRGCAWFVWLWFRLS